MSEQQPSHWGAPEPLTQPDPRRAEARPVGRSPEQTKIRTAYALLAVAGALMLTGTGVLAVRSATRTPDSGPNFAIQTVPSATPALSTRPTGPGVARQIAPRNAPYTYLMPAGYVTVPVPASSVPGQSGTHETAVAPADKPVGDLIAVSVYELGTNSEPFSYDQLEAEIDRLAKQVAAKPGEPRRLDVAGKRALRYVFDYGRTKVINYFVFTGTTELQVRCQWTNQQAVIERGCGELVTSLTLS